MTETQKLTDQFIYIRKTFIGFPTTTDQLDGNYLKEYETKIVEANKVIKKWLFLRILMFVLVILFSLLSLIVVIPMFIFYVIKVQNETNEVLKTNPILLDMEYQLGFSSDYIIIKKKNLV